MEVSMPSKFGGYMGRVVMYDLSTQTLTDYPWTDEERELFIGGKIMAAKILCDNFTGKEEAFSEENLIVISTGPLTGTGAPSSSRFNMSTLSPQTGFITSSNCGGRFGYYLKKAGIDALILKGKCEKHSWLEIDNGNFILHDADDIWGLNATPAQEALVSKIEEQKKRKVKMAQLVIGPAGENLVKYASVVSDERVAGRAGVPRF